MAFDLLNTPRNSRRKFTKHFLGAVHSEIGFAGTAIDTILASENDLKTFFEINGFDISRKIFQQEVRLENESNKLAKITHQDSPLGLAFISQKPKKEIQILDTKIIFSDFSYEGFDQFLSSFEKICFKVDKYVPRKNVIKVGLRKIDSIIIDPVNSYENACSIFNTSLFAILRSGLIKEDSLKVHEEVTVVEKNKHLCIIRAQMQKTTTPKAYQASLDFDLVDFESTNLDKVFNKTLPALNANHFDLFMWAASEELIKLMGE